MTQPIERDPIYRGRRFQTETIELCVRWYITYRLSYRDLVAMMAERGILVSHTTIMRWVLRYVPEYEKRWSRYARPVNSSWRMDETAIRVRGKSAYLYRVVDKHGKSVDSLLREDRGIEAAQAFFRKAVDTQQSTWPGKVTLDGHAASHIAIRRPSDEDRRWKSVRVRSCRYLNNIVEQDHRAIKRRCASMLGFKSFESAATVLAGIELAHRIHKGQFYFGAKRPNRFWSLKSRWNLALLKSHSCNSPRTRFPPAQTPMHQNSRVKMRRRNTADVTAPLRYARKVFYSHGLYLLVMPNGGRYWRYNYRFCGKYNTLALGIWPDVSLDEARARHQAARSVLAKGIDPSVNKRALGKRAFATRLPRQALRRNSLAQVE
jgi:transposase-like protein